MGRASVAGESRTWHFLDLVADKVTDLPAVEDDDLIHTASLWLLPDWLEKFHTQGVRRLIAFSSTNRVTKQVSASPCELDVVNKLIAAEDHVIAECTRLGVARAVFRSTLIYGGASGDRNVADIARGIRRFGFFPRFGRAGGRRQPVQARDLAMACVKGPDAPASYNNAYKLSCEETLACVDMVRRIFETLGRRPVFVRIPMVAFRVAVSLARLCPRFGHLTTDMALRMQADLVFDHGDATCDFGYGPASWIRPT